MNRIEVLTLFSQLMAAKEELDSAQAQYDTLRDKMLAVLDKCFPLPTVKKED